MRRDIDALSDRFDLLIVGAGMHGIAIARLAALAGLNTAIIDRSDFCSATSRNSAKLVHGGLRYIQHLDFARVRESATAQREWRIAAPHLVRPLRFVIPTRGHGTRGPEALAAGIALYELATFDRNRGVPSHRHLPRAGLMGRRRLVDEFPVLDGPAVTGGAHWHDAQILDAPHLAIACLADAHGSGATVANHVEAIRLLVAGGAVHGVAARDRLTGREFEIRSRFVIDATGPWTGRLATTSGLLPPATAILSRHVNLVTRRLVPGQTAIGVSSSHVSDAVVGRSRRLLFISPWQDCSIVGTWHDEFDGDPDGVGVSKSELAGWLAEINDAVPGAGLGFGDVRSVHVGLIPVAADRAGRSTRDRVTELGPGDTRGLIAVAGLKLTTAPTTARRVLGRVLARIGRSPDLSRIRFGVPLPESAPDPGGAEPHASVSGEGGDGFDWIRRIHGANAATVMAACDDADVSADERAFRCRILHAVRHEMAVTLGDALFRATDHAERGILTVAQLRWAAGAMRQRLDWSPDRYAREIATVRSRLDAIRPFPGSDSAEPASIA